MNKLKSLANQYFWLIVMVGLLLVGLSTFWGYGKYLEYKTDSQVQANQTASQTAVTAAVTSEQQATNSSIVRQTEDGVRERTIAPRLDVARRQSASSKSQLQRAKEHFNEKTIPSNSSRAGNCSRLSQLYPDTKFEYCTQR